MNIKEVKKHRKKIIFCIIILGVLLVGGATAYYFNFSRYPILVTDDSSLPYEYKIYKDYIEITRYTGEEEEVVIPDRICSRPVEVLGVYEPEPYYEEGAFNACNLIKSVYMPDSIQSISEGCFADCTNLEKVRLSPNILSTNMWVFWNCISLQSIEIPEGVLAIGADSFRGCCNLKDVKLPKTLKYIFSGAFEDCEKLAKIDIPAGVEKIEGDAFQNTGWEKSWGDGFLIVGKNVLLHYSGTEEVVEVPEGVEYIGVSVFSGCENMHILILPESVKVCGWDIVKNCKNLKYIVIENPNMEFPNIGVPDWPSLNAIYDGDGDICIVGAKGSTAEAYAEEMGYAFSESLPEEK